MAFIHNVQYHLTHISIYADGMIDCWGLVDFETFKEKVRTGWVVTQVPEGARISVSFLAMFNAQESNCFIDPEDFIVEVSDEIENLNGRSTTSSKCVDAWKAYGKSPSPENREALRNTYEVVPKHNRPYLLGDMDSKDFPIRNVLYPDELEQIRSVVANDQAPKRWWQFWK